MIPQKSKACRCKLNLSFHLSMKHKLFELVNPQTNNQSKEEAMVQLGLALQRLISTMADHHAIDLPFLFSKLDIKYGFCHMTVSDEDAWNFCNVLPFLTSINSIDDIRIVVPNSLEMG